MISEDSVFPESDIINFMRAVATGWGTHYEMGADFNYEPTQAESITALAREKGVSESEYAYDLMMADGGTGFIYFPILNYRDGNLDFLEALQIRKDTVNSLSDAGAHCGTICDAASTTFMLQYWVKDRLGARITIQNAIRRQCHDTARLYALDDRGAIARGFLADLNVIDMDKISLDKPWLAFDLPAGGKRLLQKANGYIATIKSGQITFRNGVMQGPTPGIVIRGPQTIDYSVPAK